MSTEFKINQIKAIALTQSKVFCMAPWTHIHNMPNGDLHPCCLSAIEEPMGNIYEHTIEEVWNNEKYKEIRTSMLNEKPISKCDRCYKEEEWGNTNSTRKFYNTYYEDKFNDLVVKQTNNDGSMKEMKVFRWDFRFSNLCNLTCIGCSKKYSSSWADLDKKMYPEYDIVYTEDKFRTSNRDKELFLKTIKSQSQYANDIYLAGGEPLIQQEHYDILKIMDEAGKLGPDVHYCYSTSLASIKFKQINVVTDYWKRMARLKILVSLDEVDQDRLYYIRYPSNINTIVENIRTLNKEFTETLQRWTITPTWNILNIHRMKDIVNFFRINDLLHTSFYESIEWEVDLHNILLMYPHHLSILSATPDWKSYINKSLTEFEEWYLNVMIPLKNLNVQIEAIKILQDNIQRFKNSMIEETEVKPAHVLDRVDWTKRLDQARGTNFLETFPELTWYLN